MIDVIRAMFVLFELFKGKLTAKNSLLNYE